MKTKKISQSHLFEKQMLGKSLITILFVALFSISSFSQQLLNWPLAPNQINFVGTAPATSALPMQTAG